MARVSIKDYAEQNSVSYEAVRRQIKRYSKELKGHIHKVGRSRYLDDHAIDFLNDRRKSNPVIVQEVEKNETLEILKTENDRLKTLLLEAQQKIIDLQDDNTKLIQTEAKIKALEGDKKTSEKKLHEAEENLSEAKITLSKTEEKLKEAEAEANSYQKSIFGLYRKVKK